MDPRFGSVDRLLEAVSSDLAVVPRQGMEIDRAPIRELLALDPQSRISKDQLVSLNLLSRRRVRFAVVGNAAARLHGAPVPVPTLELSFGEDPINPRRFEKALRMDKVSELQPCEPEIYKRLRQNAEPLPWLPPPTMRVMNLWLDAPSGFLLPIEDLITMAVDPDRRALLAAVQQEIDRASPGFRMRGRRAVY